MPKDFRAISEAEDIMIEKHAQTNTTHFSINHPISRVNIIASDDFKVQSQHYHDINISTYFFSQHDSLAKSYIEQTIHDIQKYEKHLGTFPYTRFNIVENHFQTGYSMPTFTLIGDKIIKMPFLLNTSLGHEILHQWFGNSLFNDYKQGNWMEGITTYLADHRYHDKPQAYRKNILHEYALYVESNNSDTLATFTHRHDKKSASIGYGKGAFAFHMLQKRLGEEKFFTILKDFYQAFAFQKASYHDIESFFCQKSGKDLQPLFHFLFEKTSLIHLTADDFHLTYHDDHNYQLDFTIHTKEGNLTLPLTLLVNKKPYTIKVKDNTSVSLTLNQRPKTLTLDPHFDLFRELSPHEKLHTLSQAFAKDKNILEHTKIDKSAKKGFFIQVDSNGTLKMRQSDTGQSHGMKQRLPHYGKYQSLHFIDGKLVQKNKPSTQNGIMISLYKEDANLSLALQQAQKSRIVFVGEHHDNFAHHQNQLHIIQTLYAQNPNIAIGMEMFQRRFQPILDAYIQEEIDENTFLEKSEYFARWGYNYRLYKPIIDFAKKHHVPLIALNLEKEITKKISKNGILSLTKEENATIPQSLDFSNRAYQTRLNAIFDDPQHFAHLPTSQRPDPIHLYQAQILWDETMAESAANYLKTHPKRIMIVLVGNGHLEYSVGIPDRVSRRIDIHSSVILQDVDFQENIAPYILHPHPMQTAFPTKLGVYLEGKSLKVLDIVPDSPAQKFCIHKEDVITSIDKHPLKTLSDLQLRLYQNKGKFHTLSVTRKGKTIHLTKADDA